ncbi:MAG: aromatic ring-hydroxylating dioxygenase subunit alpha [Actinomycetota bacterium]
MIETGLENQLAELIAGGPRPAAMPATQIDTSAYTSPEQHAEELTAMAARPAAALSASELAEPGSFVTTELSGVPLIVSRDRDGAVHAMHNACAHRGSTVETRPDGSARIFSCGFHGWSYQLDGSLRTVADAPLFSSEPCERGLRAVPCEERHGVIWVTARPTDESPTVADWLGAEADALLDELGLADMVRHAETDYELACNWKLLTDGFLEIYHLKYLHRNSIAPYFPANLSRVERLGDHFLALLPKNRLVTTISEQPREEWDILNGLTAALTLVPGTVVQWQAGHVELFSLRPHPTDPGRTTARLTMLVPRSRADETELWDRNWERVNVTIPDEDFAAAVDVQANIGAGAVPVIQIGANEHGLVEHLTAVDELTR